MRLFVRASQILPAACLAIALFSAEPAQLRLIEIDPAHSHLSSLHSRMLPGFSDVVDIYSPLTPELTGHLTAITRDNARSEKPTHWSVRLFAGPDYLQQMQKEAPGAIVALSGRNSTNIHYIEIALHSGDHVFADKPWIIDEDAFPRLEAAVTFAREKHLVTYDWMSLREEVPYRLVRDLVQMEPVFGLPDPGSIENPSVHLENLHALLKYSNGVPQRRPPMFLDVRQQGEGMADVGTHLVDLAQWTLFPNQAIAYRSDIRVLRASHAALKLSLEQFTRLTGGAAWPAYLNKSISGGALTDYTNGTCVYALKGVHVSLKVGWQYEAPPGDSDSYFASYRGTKALVELRAGPKEHFVPEIYITPAERQQASWESSLRAAVKQIQGDYPGLSVQAEGRSFHLLLPKATRASDGLLHIFKALSGYVRQPNTFPEFERDNLLAKYYVTTKAVAMANGR